MVWLGILLTIENSQVVKVGLLAFELHMPLYAVALFSFLIGFLLPILWLGPKLFRAGRRLRRARKNEQGLQNEISTLLEASADEDDIEGSE